MISDHADLSKHAPPYADRVYETEIENGSVYLLRTTVPEVVSFRGSIRTNPDFGKGELMQQQLCVSLLDKGTRRRDRFEIAQILENRGAELRFSSDKNRVVFSGKALKEDVPTVIRMLGEQLREPALETDQFNVEKSRLAALLHRSLESTGAQAAGALSRKIYPLRHPNYIADPAAELKRLNRLTVESVREYHAQHFGASELLLVFVGDIPDGLVPVANDVFSGWSEPPFAGKFEPRAYRAAAGRSEVPMADRLNLDVHIGQGVPLRRGHPDYLPLYVGAYILGGNFSARLMTSIRDELGLTYGIDAGMTDVDVEYDGHFEVGVTLSQENLERGIEATVSEIRRFVEDGVGDDEVADKQTTIAGAYKVGLATTGGLALALLINIQRRFGVRYLDEFPQLVADVSTENINAAVRKYLSPDEMHIAVAGTLAVQETTAP